MRKSWTLAAACLAVLAVAGCKMNLTASLYSTDIREAASGKTGLFAPARLSFQVPSVDECAKYTAQISEIMAGVVKDFSPRGCGKVGLDSYLLADIQMPLVVSNTWGAADSLFGLIVTRRESGDILAVIALNKQKYEILTSRMKNKFGRKVDIEESNVTLIVNNDERASARLWVTGKFLNNVPVLNNKNYELPRRHKAEIRLSDVSTAALALRGLAGGFILRKSN